MAIAPRNVRRRVGVGATPCRTSYEAGLSLYPDLDGVHPVSGLGLDLSAISSFIPGGNLLVGGGMGVETAITDLTGGAKTDAGRLARVNWTIAAAKRGSVLAAEIILAGPNNTAGTERTMWVNALAQIPQTMVAQASQVSPNGWWPTGQPDFYTDVNGPTHTQIVQQVNSASAVGTAVGGSIASAVSSLSRTSPMVWLLGAGLVGVVLMRKR